MPRNIPDPGTGQDYEVAFGTSGSPSAGPYSNASGMVPISGVNPSAGSGTIGTFPTSGPWMIETQNLRFRYARVPVAGGDGKIDLSLSAADYTVYHQGTYLHACYGGSYKKIKSYDFYPTSSFVQPQKFMVYSVSSDPSGNTYGDMPSGTNVAFGPQGEVKTTQEWYYRRPWVDSVDVSVVTTLTPTLQTFGVARYEQTTPGTFVSATGGHQTNNLMGSMKRAWMPSEEAFDTMGLGPDFISEASFIDYKSGGYSTATETVADVWTTINVIGEILSTGEGGFSATGAIGEQYPPGVIAQYDISRHDFT